MKTRWHDFLNSMGAEFDNDELVHFGNPERERRASDNGLVIADLSHIDLVKASGTDASSFLQGQLTNNIDEVNETRSQLSGYCNQKGRLLASFRVFKRDNDFYLCIPEELYEGTFKRLRMYVMRSDVDFTNCSADEVSIGFSGPAADTELEKHFSSIPMNVDDVVQHGDISIIKLAGEHPRFQISGLIDQITDTWKKLDVNAAPVGKDVWNLLEIRAGIPTIYQQTTEAFVPQMVNLELINGVSFKKGCYTGQEIVARMHYLGKLKRRMYRIHIDTRDPVEAGTPLFSPDTTSGQGTGSIVISAPSSDQGMEALAVMQISESEKTDLKLTDAQGASIQVLEIPYEFPAEAEKN